MRKLLNRRWIAEAPVLLLAGSVTCYMAINYIAAIHMPPYGKPNWDQKKIEKSIAIGNELVINILRYKIDNNTFPTRLDELIPRYSEIINCPTAGDCIWHYVSFGDRFNLKFCVDGGYPSINYSYDLGTWFIDQ